MKSFNTQFKNKKSLLDFISSNSIDEYENVLVQIFSGVIDEKKSISLSSSIAEMLPNAKIIGTTTSGEICSGKVLAKTISISFSVFKNTIVRSNFYKLDKNFHIQDLANDLIVDDTKVLIIFSDGLKSNAEELLKEIHSLKADMVIAGGRAGDNSKFIKTYVFDEKNYSENGCVIATLSSKELIVNNDYILNWTAIGKDMTVTKVDKNILYELDGIPILDIYRKYLGDDVVKNLPESAMEFPLIVRKNSLSVARDPIAKTKDDALIFAGNFELGDNVQFSFGNIEDIAGDVDQYFNDFSEFPAESIFVYSCSARKALMGGKLDAELNMLESLATTSGFFTYGEYFHASNIVELLNVTTTFLALSESKTIKKRALKKSKDKDTDPVKKALTHLVKVTIEELEHISTHDALTSICNRAEYIKRIELKIKSAKRYNESFGLILIDIDHFKLINDNYGHAVGDKVLKKLAKVFVQSVREDDLVARWGGEEFIIVANYASVEILEKLIKKLQQKIAKLSFSPVTKLTVSFGLSVYVDGDSEETLFRRVDNALYAAKQAGRDRYIIG